MEFSDEELFFIEQEFDLKAGILHNHLLKVVEQFMVMGCVNYLDDKEKDLIRKNLMKNIQEIHRCIDLVKSIRDKLEENRHAKLH